MAGSESGVESHKLDLTSYETALCVIPPLHYCQEVDKLRELYDKGYGRWPPHINLLYPFVAIEHLAQAKKLLEAKISGNCQYRVRLNSAGCFSCRQGYTIFASENVQSENSSLKSLRDSALEALGQNPTPHAFHLTIGQSADGSLSARDFLLSKAKLLPPVEFDVNQLVILVRVRTLDRDHSSNHMKLWDTLSESRTSLPASWPTTDFWIRNFSPTMSEEDEQRIVCGKEIPSDLDSFEYSHGRHEATYYYDSDVDAWKPMESSSSPSYAESPSKSLSISTYNVLMDSHYPPLLDREPSLLSVILSQPALADVLVLEEVSDGFLTCLLADNTIRKHYVYCSHGPSNQVEIGPLPSMRNVVVLSRSPFSWTWLPFQRCHKGAVIACFHNVGINLDSSFRPLVLGCIHLTSGLTDGAVAAKRIQMSTLLNYFKREHIASPWVIAGDFNITTSSATIELALRDKSISQRTVDVLSTIETSLGEAGLLDCWSIARLEAADDSAFSPLLHLDDLCEGEEGATFNPQVNALATETSGTAKNRPQRYDRILVRGLSLLRTSRFNMFGLPEEPSTTEARQTQLHDAPSDHFGVRAVLEVLSEVEAARAESSEAPLLPPIQAKPLNPWLASGSALTAALSQNGMYPSEADITRRRDAFALIQAVISGNPAPDTASSQVLLEITAVGSYALGVWSSTSDIDCLCIGNISHRTFFKLARQRIKRAASQGVRILRKVEANTGTMLELSVNGIYVDLQYCAATRVVEKWSSIAHLSHDDPSFDLPILSLRKLKPYRDLDYVQRTIPDMAAFRIAFRCVKLWAMRNGLYSSKFGYLGGIHITLLLSSLCKRMAHQNGSFTAEGLVRAFFHYYAHFNWGKDMVYDPFFHRGQPRYHRTAREPIVILGFHAPNSNVAHTSTIPGLDVLVREFQRADGLLSDPLMTWAEFFGTPDVGNSDVITRDFLRSFEDYVRIEVQFWGRTLSKGKSLVGWVESRCLVVVVEIQKLMPDLVVRIWPARFTTTDDTTGKDYQGCYLIGISRKNGSENATTKPDRRMAKDAMITVFKRFENQLRSDEKHYDAASAWISVELAKRSEVESLHLDPREWGDPLAEEDEDSEVEEDDPEPVEGEEQGDVVLPLPVRPSVVTGSVGGGKKLRPASDILNRLRWDPHLNLADYIVGYEDRFLGAKELALEKWKTEKTDEEFIPQHRILYFRRRSDGVVVWERKSRIDRIFGSGVGSGEAPGA